MRTIVRIRLSTSTETTLTTKEILMVTMTTITTTIENTLTHWNQVSQSKKLAAANS